MLLNMASSCRHCVLGRKLRRQKQRASRSDSNWVSRGHLALDRRQTGQPDLLPCATWLRKHGHEVPGRRVLARHLLRRLPWSARRCLHCFVPRATRPGLPHRRLDQEEQLRPCEMRLDVSSCAPVVCQRPFTGRLLALLLPVCMSLE